MSRAGKAGFVAIIASLAALAAFVRIGYRELRWGGYWYVDFVAPWRR